MFEHRYKEEKDNVVTSNTTPSKKDTKNTQELEENTSLESNNIILNDDKPLKIETWADIIGPRNRNTINTPFQKFEKKYGQRKAYQYAFAYIMQKYCLYYDEKAGQFEIDVTRLQKENQGSLHNRNTPLGKKYIQSIGAKSYYNHSVITSKDDYLVLGKNWAGAKAYRSDVRDKGEINKYDPEYSKFRESKKRADETRERIAQGPQKEEKEIEIDDQNISFLDVMELTLATVGVVTSFATMEIGIGMASIGFALDGFQATAQKLIDKYNNVYKSSTTYEIGKLIEQKIHGTTIIYDSTNMFFALRSVKNGSIALFKGKPPTDKTVIDGLVNKMNASTFYIPQYVENHISKLLPSKDSKITTTRKIKK